MDLVTVTDLHRPTGRDDLHASLLAGATPLAGGTALHGERHEHLTGLVDLLDLDWTDLESVPGGAADGDNPAAELRVAATTTLRTVLDHPVTAPIRPFLHDTFSCLLASWKIWSRGTWGGNLCAALPAGAGTAAACTLGATAEIWTPDGDVRTVPAAEFVTGPGTTVLASGEVLRALRFPASRLRSRYAVRRYSLVPSGRSSALVTGRVDPDGRCTLVVTAAVPAPEVLVWECPVTPGEAAEAVRALPRWYADPQGDPAWRRHVAGAGAAAVIEELTSRQEMSCEW